jgi:hypothetical protein
MEVHHHPDLHHKKKNFREYFLEFLMIFLAVTLGFFAESFREHITDAVKEKEYIKGIIRNLQTDTVKLHNSIKDGQVKLKGVDSLLTLVRTDLAPQINCRLFYHCYRRYLTSGIGFKSDDETLTQLRNAGGYRLIQKKGAADSISKYDRFNNEIYGQGEVIKNTEVSGITDLANELIDRTIFKDTSYYYKGNFTSKKLPPVFNDPQKIKIFFNKVDWDRGINSVYINYLKIQSVNAENLIVFFKKTYNLENE